MLFVQPGVIELASIETKLPVLARTEIFDVVAQGEETRHKSNGITATSSPALVKICLNSSLHFCASNSISALFSADGKHLFSWVSREMARASLTVPTAYGWRAEGFLSLTETTIESRS